MRLRCRLRDLRGRRTLAQVLASARDADPEVKLSRGTLSELERGVRLPTDAQTPALEHAYGLMTRRGRRS